MFCIVFSVWVKQLLLFNKLAVGKLQLSESKPSAARNIYSLQRRSENNSSLPLCVPLPCFLMDFIGVKSIWWSVHSCLRCCHKCITGHYLLVESIVKRHKCSSDVQGRERVWRYCFIWKKQNASFAVQKQHRMKRLGVRLLVNYVIFKIHTLSLLQILVSFPVTQQ